ncbi:MAG: chemotaxis protein CheB [Sterolibacterium sp.]
MLATAFLRPDRSDTLHVAGIGASAGGIEAMLPMFARLPATGRIAYVVAQHMAHNGHSDLVARLLGRESALPVTLAHDGERLLADTVYVIPAGKDGCVKNGAITLQPPGKDNLSTPSVNTLFASIGEASRKQSVGILLSGTGSDGTAGCRAIRQHGGLTIAQEPAEAKFDGMPSAAINAGVVDKVLSVDMIGGLLAEIFPGAVVTAPTKALASTESSLPDATDSVSEEQHRELEHLLRLVHQATHIDFSSYKEDTLLRRLEKRKATLGIVGADQYLALVRRQPEELHALQHLFLVSVTSFFRDRASFRILEQNLAALVASKADFDPIRVWVPGCASGEESYTLAILLAELLGEYRSRHAVSILGSDLNPAALEMARAGVYRLTAFKEMEEDLRSRYFTAKGQHYEVSPALREMVAFEQRDVLSGPPAGGPLDLVSCRNLLIYMKSQLQDQLIKSFHQALRPQGLLFIGQSESLSFVGNSLFGPIDHYHRLFRRRH